jgi:hypothetical protein
MNDKCEIEIEIESLNLDQLDVEELEHRLEMAVAGPTSSASCGGLVCYSFS